MLRLLKLAWLPATLLVGAALLAAGVPLPEGPAKKTVESACSACHTLDILADKKWSREKWENVIHSMVARGAKLREDETAAVADYLTRHFGAETQVRELVEGICSQCHELGKIEDQHLNREQWAALIKGMIYEGAPVTEEEFSMIVEYLTRHYGPQEETQ
jgi:hypothetical protein